MLEMEDFPKQLLIHYRAHWTAQLCFTWSTEVQIYKTSGNNAGKGPRAIQTLNQSQRRDGNKQFLNSSERPGFLVD